MKTLGRIEAIVNDRLVIVSSSEELNPNDVISVFSTIEDPRLKELGYPDPILYPRGELRILCQQQSGKYLAEPFRETRTKTRTIVGPPPIARSLANALAQLQPETKEVTEEIEGKWSAKLNTSQSLKINVPDVVSVGDFVGRR